MNVIPGEPIPPGFEDEINRVAAIQKVIQSYKGNALVGIEYALELIENGREREPYYMCVLCDKRCDPRTIMQHWTSYGHRLEYLDKHFSTVMHELEPIRNKQEKMKLMVQALSEAIERHHGRGQLSVCSIEDFRRSKSKIFDDVKSKKHFDEQNGPNFVSVIDRSLLQVTAQQKADKLDKSKKVSELDEISSDSDASPHVPKKSKQQQVANRVVPPAKRLSPSFNADSRAEKRVVHFPTPKELSLQASHIAQERYKWEKYRCMLEIYLKQMEKSFESFEKIPEKHPQYPEEWKAFWNRRYKELQKEKKVDPNKYDYRPEWAVFWSKRRKELFDIEIEKKKKEIKQKLELPEDAEEILDRLKEKYKVQSNRSSNESNGGEVDSKTSRRENNVIDISDDETIEKSPRTRHLQSHSRNSRVSRSISPRSRVDQKRPRIHRSKSRSMSPFSDEFDFGNRKIMRGKAVPRSRVIQPALSSFSTRRYAPPGVEVGYREVVHPYYKHSHYSSHYRSGMESFPMHSQYDDRSPSPPPPHLLIPRKEPSPEPEEEGPLTVVAVLRLLTALEDILGSLGPKMVDLLGKALALDNVKANSADELLLNDDNIVFFETAKEKLKGLLIAEVIEDSQKVRAVKKAIRNIAAIVHQVSSKGKTADKKEDSTLNLNVSAANVTSGSKVNKSAKIKDLPFDRQLVASKLAAELVKHGREDLSTADMDKLIYFFILMVKLSKDKFEIDGKPLHLKDIATEIGIKIVKPAAPPVKLSMPAKPTRMNLSFEDPFEEEEALNAEISNDKSERSKNEGGGSSLESLTDSDLQTLLQNFKHLSAEEQHHLIAHLKKLETSDPVRVEKLRKFVNLNDLGETAEETHSNPASSQRGRNDASNSSFTSNRASTSKHREDDDSPRRSVSRDRINDSDDNTNHSHQRGSNVVNPNKFSLDDEDDDDYNFDDVLKAASSIVDKSARQSNATISSFNRFEEPSTSKSNSRADPPAPGTSKSTNDALTFNRAALNTTPSITLSDTQNLIANLMGNLQQNNASKKPPSSNEPTASQSVPTVQHPVNNSMPSQNSTRPCFEFNQPFNQQQYPQHQYPPQYPSQPHQQQQQQQPPPPPPPPQGYGMNNQMGYNQMGYDPPYYGYNNTYQGYPQQPQQQWGSNYNMYGGN